MKKTYIQPASKVYEIKAKTSILSGSQQLNVLSEGQSGSNALSDRFRRGSSWDEE